jgi:hypothetical protein
METHGITTENAIIDHVVMYVLDWKNASSLLGLDGKQQDTRKNPHVIDAGFVLDIIHN